MQKIQAIYKHLTGTFVERQDIVYGLLTALIARQHLLLIGSPGTAKSAILVELARCITGAAYFQRLLTKFSTPEEIFGPVSLKGLEQDIYQRNTKDKLPEAHIGFVDEIFKANSAILNTLLTLINERIFENNGHLIQAPLMSLFGASNEYPEEDENLAALYDRFLLRYEVGPIMEAMAFAAMLTSKAPTQRPQITLTELQQLQDSARMVQITQDIIDALVFLRKDLIEKNIIPSDRRWKQSLSLIQARAVINGRNIADISDMEILKDCLWETPDQKDTVAGLVKKFCVDQVTAEIQQYLAEAQEVTNNAVNEGTTEAGTEANKKIKNIQASLKRIAEQHPNKAVMANKGLEDVTTLNQNMLNVCLGI